MAVLCIPQLGDVQIPCDGQTTIKQLKSLVDQNWKGRPCRLMFYREGRKMDENDPIIGARIILVLQPLGPIIMLSVDILSGIMGYLAQSLLWSVGLVNKTWSDASRNLIENVRPFANDDYMRRQVITNAVTERFLSFKKLQHISLSNTNIDDQCIRLITNFSSKGCDLRTLDISFCTRINDLGILRCNSLTSININGCINMINPPYSEHLPSLNSIIASKSCWPQHCYSSFPESKHRWVVNFRLRTMAGRIANLNDIPVTCTIAELRKTAAKRVGIKSVDPVALIYKHTLLQNDSWTIERYGISDGQDLHISFKLLADDLCLCV
eukprot:NODE_5103_length_1067_cov_19.706568_g4547_i0.p1 GENE.NODE_5103_length_1067_cov_19.706568_g4547_i0~~NODE_5103_length_1067_cov_19.706568_g4547_i0.p1  ORF type:complete len:324 (-),score=32.39 NODE_5103_length_1067_cov_19.706568_g4547_i0:35-1006(-)